MVPNVQTLLHFAAIYSRANVDIHINVDLPAVTVTVIKFACKVCKFVTVDGVGEKSYI